MAKASAKKSGKSEEKAAAKPSSSNQAKSPSSKAAAKIASGLRKQLHRLQSQFEDAQSVERKRVRKLEKARHRRQIAEAALADVLADTPVPGSGLAAADSAKVAVGAPAKRKNVPASAQVGSVATPAKPATARRVATRPVAAKPVAAKTTPARATTRNARPATAAVKSPATAAEPAQPRPARGTAPSARPRPARPATPRSAALKPPTDGAAPSTEG